MRPSAALAARLPAVALPLALLVLICATTGGGSAHAETTTTTQGGSCNGGNDADGGKTCSASDSVNEGGVGVGGAGARASTERSSYGWLRYDSPLDGPCSIERVVASEISFREFTKTFKNKRPVILTGLRDGRGPFTSPPLSQLNFQT